MSADDCNWAPIKPSRTHEMPEFCGQPSVQHWDMRAGGQIVRMLRCQEHRLSVEFISKLQGAEHR